MTAQSRSKTFLSGVTLAYLYLGSMMVVGLSLIPFCLRQLGAHDYGVWLVGPWIFFCYATWACWQSFRAILHKRIVASWRSRTIGTAWAWRLKTNARVS
jgi:hypothetical protein